MINPFDSSRDEALGRLLREHLDPEGDAEAFVGRVRAALPSQRSSWEVLSEWARPGIAAALLAATALGWALSSAALADETGADAAEFVSAVMSDSLQPSSAAVAALVLEAP